MKSEEKTQLAISILTGIDSNVAKEIIIRLNDSLVKGDVIQFCVQLQEDINILSKIECAEAKELVQILSEVLTDNQKPPRNKKTRINIFNYCSKDETRPTILGVCHNHTRKEAVATDASILLVSKLDYQEIVGSKGCSISGCSDECSILGKKNNIIKGAYPNYNAVLPQEKQTPVSLYSECLLEENITKARQKLEQLKLEKSYNSEVIPVKVSDSIVMNISSVDLIQRLDQSKFTCKDDSGKYPLHYEDDFYKIVLMPVLVGKKSSK